MENQKINSMPRIKRYDGVENEQDGYAPRNKTERDIINECNAIAELLIDKNRAYGNSFREPVGIFSKASPVDQIRTRLDDKLNRLIQGHEYANEDTVLDLIGYLILYRIVLNDK